MASSPFERKQELNKLLGTKTEVRPISASIFFLEKYHFQIC